MYQPFRMDFAPNTLKNYIELVGEKQIEMNFNYLWNNMRAFRGQL